MHLSLAISLGDVIVAMSIVGTVFLAYQAFKGQIAAFRAHLASYDGRIAGNEERLNAHGRALRIHGNKIAALEGRVFGRRVDDRNPDEGEIP